MRSSQLIGSWDLSVELMCSYDEQELEAQDVGEEEGMNEANVDETMIVVCSPPRLVKYRDSLGRNQIHKIQGRSNVREKQLNQTRRV
jgi:hypothetical protein